MKCDSGKLLLAVDIAGTFLFGIEGADAAIRSNLDLLGLMVLAFSTALSEGVVRDLLIGAVPPEAIRDWRYATTAFAAALVAFFFYPYVEAFSGSVMMLLHAAGLALFALAGSEKAIDYKTYPFMAALLGAVTGVGGGTIRDIFLARSSRPASGYLCDGRAGGRRDFDCCPQAWYFGDTCGDGRWRLLLCSPSRCRLFPLEFAAHRESVVICSMARI
jgi:hypothetical protein